MLILIDCRLLDETDRFLLLRAGDIFKLIPKAISFAQSLYPGGHVVLIHNAQLGGHLPRHANTVNVCERAAPNSKGMRWQNLIQILHCNQACSAWDKGQGVCILSPSAGTVSEQLVTKMEEATEADKIIISADRLHHNMHPNCMLSPLDPPKSKYRPFIQQHSMVSIFEQVDKKDIFRSHINILPRRSDCGSQDLPGIQHLSGGVIVAGSWKDLLKNIHNKSSWKPISSDGCTDIDVVYTQSFTISRCG